MTLDHKLPAVAALTPKQAAFARAYVETGNAMSAYTSSYDCKPDIGRDTVRQRAHELVHAPKVRDYINDLKNAAAERVVLSVARQLADLDALADVDISEVWRLEFHSCGKPCETLWNADLLAGRPIDMTAGYIRQHAKCPSPVQAHQRAILRPTHEWSPAARMLFDGFETARDGTLRPIFRSRSTLRDMALKVQGAYVSKSISATYEIPAASKQAEAAKLMTPAELCASLWRPT